MSDTADPTVEGSAGNHSPLSDSEARSEQRIVRIESNVASGTGLASTVLLLMLLASWIGGHSPHLGWWLIVGVLALISYVASRAADDRKRPIRAIAEGKLAELYLVTDSLPATRAMLASWVEQGLTIRQRDVEYLHSAAKRERDQVAASALRNP